MSTSQFYWAIVQKQRKNERVLSFTWISKIWSGWLGEERKGFKWRMSRVALIGEICFSLLLECRRSIFTLFHHLHSTTYHTHISYSQRDSILYDIYIYTEWSTYSSKTLTLVKVFSMLREILWDFLSGFDTWSPCFLIAVEIQIKGFG